MQRYAYCWYRLMCSIFIFKLNTLAILRSWSNLKFTPQSGTKQGENRFHGLDTGQRSVNKNLWWHVCLSGGNREEKTTVLVFPCLLLQLEKLSLTVARQPSPVSMQSFYISVREMMSGCGGGGSELFSCGLFFSAVRWGQKDQPQMKGV